MVLWLGIPPDKDEFIVEIFNEDSFFGIMERVDEKFILKINNHSKNDGWEIDLEHLLQTYKKYRSRLNIDE